MRQNVLLDWLPDNGSAVHSVTLGTGSTSLSFGLLEYGFNVWSRLLCNYVA